MNFFYTITLIAATVSAFGEWPKTQKCEDLPLAKVDFQKVIQNGPYIKFWGTELVFKCGEISFTNYIAKRNCYIGKAIIISSFGPLLFDLTFEDGGLFRATACTNGTVTAYRVILYNVNDLNSSYFCIAVCDKNGEFIEDIVCSGRTYKDAMAIEKFLKFALKVKIVKPLRDLREGCPKLPYCYGF